MESEVIKIRRYKVGYEIRTTIVTWQLTREIFPELDVPVDIEYPRKLAYTPNGHLIGSSCFAHYLIVKRGIKPELAEPDHKFCSIGFCDREQRWYGWSGQGLCGFGIDGIAEKEDWLLVSRGISKYSDESPENTLTTLIEFQAKTFEDVKKRAIDFANTDSLSDREVEFLIW